MARSVLNADKLTQLLAECDPIGLIAIGCPDDEYAPEAGTILPRLREAYSAADVQRIAHEEFTHWFSPAVAGPIEVYAATGAAIWQWLNREP